MKLIKLLLENFMGIKSFTLVLDGEDAQVFGDNGTGKTTLHSAFLWLLFGKDSANRSDFEIKTLTPDGEPLHNLNHVVEVVILLADGKKLTLRKVYTEKWVKKKGEVKATFSGHTTEHYVNGVPVKAGEYAEKINTLMDEDLFKMLTSPTYFNEQLNWKQRRDILMEVCGDVSDDEVLKTNKSLKGLGAILKDHSIEEYRKILAARRRDIYPQIDKILPTRIDEVTRMLIDTTGDEKALKAEKEKLKKEVASLEKEMGDIENNETQSVEKEIDKLTNQLTKLRQEREQQEYSELSSLRNTENELAKEVMSLETQDMQAESKQDRLKHQIGDLENDMKSLRDMWHTVNAEEFTFVAEDSCPTCGQDLPREKVEEARENALKAFNLTKSKRLEDIGVKGLAKKEEVARLKDELETMISGIGPTRSKLAEKKDRLESLRSQIRAFNNEGKARVPSEEEAAILDKISDLKGNAQSAKESVAELVSEKKALIKEKADRLEDIEIQLSDVIRNADSKKRIEQLREELSALVEEYEKLDEDMYLTDEFIRTKVTVLETKINSKFELARFKLFETQQNGAIAECCETLYEGVPYSGGLNNAARINVGLDIIRTLSEHYGVSAPIFVDNAEAVTKLIDMNAQVITLVVSEQDKELRITTQKEEK